MRDASAGALKIFPNNFTTVHFMRDDVITLASCEEFEPTIGCSIVTCAQSPVTWFPVITHVTTSTWLWFAYVQPQLGNHPGFQKAGGRPLIPGQQLSCLIPCLVRVEHQDIPHDDLHGECRQEMSTAMASLDSVARHSPAARCISRFCHIP